MKVWLAFVIGAGLCWGTYVPLIAYGGLSLSDGTKGIANRFAAILCVGGAYFVLGVLFPLGYFLLNGPGNAQAAPNGIVFASLAGVAGAAGAICVVFATAAATPGDRIYIAPLIFGLAPIINALVSLCWHPNKESAWRFHLETPSPLLLVGIVLTGIGAALVLYAKETAEAAKSPGKPPIAAPATPATQPS